MTNTANLSRLLDLIEADDDRTLDEVDCDRTAAEHRDDDMDD